MTDGDVWKEALLPPTSPALATRAYPGHSLVLRQVVPERRMGDVDVGSPDCLSD